jgi:predicted methyltransferase
MIPTTHEEALVDLALACAEGASGFAACAERAQLPALKAALRLRSEQCRHALDVLRALCADVAPGMPVASLAPGVGDARVFTQYEAIEGHVLSAFRDSIEQDLPREMSTSLVAQFEIALKQYMQLVALRARLPSAPVASAALAQDPSLSSLPVAA